ncbi:MAG: phosphoribosylaminoimidazolesuccinocarboxamide synthase [Chloroflexi bacterium]|nr:phosphoribosylaminoimidazolesuccinocarboxamide synthase [Chloroflexota bacterium]
MEPAILTVDLPGIPLYARGKVRDVFDLGEHLLIVATDRISAFDHVLPTGIPGKGALLNQLSAFWFQQLRPILPNHMVTVNEDEFPVELQPFRSQLRRRSMLVRKAQRIDVECVARGYLSGSGWVDYQRDGAICGISLPRGLVESQRLPEPIFTPATKAASGHDINISFEEVTRMVGRPTAERLRDLTLTLYAKAAQFALQRGIIIADTKFEFGYIDGQLILIDEALTPDSSRFWDAAIYTPGHSQDSFDKQFVRDWLIQSGWDREPPAPPLPDDVVAKTAAKYHEAYRRLTGRELE